jgi:hypothetical protein
MVRTSAAVSRTTDAAEASFTQTTVQAARTSNAASKPPLHHHPDLVQSLRHGTRMHGPIAKRH